MDENWLHLCTLIDLFSCCVVGRVVSNTIFVSHTHTCCKKIYVRSRCGHDIFPLHTAKGYVIIKLVPVYRLYHKERKR